MKQIMFVMGNSQEAVRMGALIEELQLRSCSRTMICTVGTQEDKMKKALALFRVHPEDVYHVQRSKEQTLGITRGSMHRIKEVLHRAAPDIVMLYGESVLAYMTALACRDLNIPVAHTGAGIRGYDTYISPAAEFNRNAVDAVSRFYFVPTVWNRQNLINERKDPDSIFVTGTPGIDAVRVTLRKSFEHPALEWTKGCRFVLIALSGRQGKGVSRKHLLGAVREVSQIYPQVRFICPAVLSPEEMAFAGNIEALKVIEPLDITALHNFIKRCYCVVTDCGCVQEEAPAMHKPVLVLGCTTERPEGVCAGTVKLVGTQVTGIACCLLQLLGDRELYHRMSCADNPYGDGRASERIADVLESIV